MTPEQHLEYARKHRALAAKEPAPGVAAAHIRFAEAFEKKALNAGSSEELIAAEAEALLASLPRGEEVNDGR